MHPWRNWIETGHGPLSDWGVHHVDIAQWALGAENTGPIEVEGKGTWPQGREETLSVLLGKAPATSLPNGFSTVIDYRAEMRFANGNVMKIAGIEKTRDGKRSLVGTRIEGADGHLWASRSGKQFELTGELIDEIRADQAQNKALTEAAVGLYKGKTPDWSTSADQIGDIVPTTHMGNFVDCVRDRSEPISDVWTHHRSTSSCLLANISMLVDRKITWDPAKEEIVGDDEANALLKRQQRAPYGIEESVGSVFDPPLRGFDEAFIMVNGYRFWAPDVMVFGSGGMLKELNQPPVAKRLNEWEMPLDGEEANKATRMRGKYAEDVTVDFLCDFLERRASGKEPFFAYYSSKLVHVPPCPNPDDPKAEQEIFEEAFARTYDRHFKDLNKTLLFDYCARKPPADYGEDSIFNPSHMTSDMTYNIYKLNLETRELRQLTDTKYNDSCPAWLPDGRIVFISDRGGCYVRCHGSGPKDNPWNKRGMHQPCATMHSMAADGSDVVPISWHETSETFPRVTNDGRMSQVRKITPGLLPSEGKNPRKELPYSWPWPLSEDYYIVRDPKGAWVLLDRFGNSEVMFKDQSLFAIPRKARPRPPVLPVQTYQNHQRLYRLQWTDGTFGFDDSLSLNVAVWDADGQGPCGWLEAVPGMKVLREGKSLPSAWLKGAR